MNKHADLCRWWLLDKSLWWGRGLQHLLGNGRPRAWEGPCRKLLACRGDDITWLLGWLWHKGGLEDGSRWGFWCLSWRLPAEAHLAELCSHIISLQTTERKKKRSRNCLVSREAHRGRPPRAHAWHLWREEVQCEKVKEINSPSRTREHKNKQIRPEAQKL